MIYLAKRGKVHGPFSDQEYRSLVESGEADKFFWKWDEKSKQWCPLDPPPPPLTGSKKSRLPLSREWDAICSDHREIVSGRVSQITETGCLLEDQSAKATPPLSTRSWVLIQLYDPQSGKSTHTRGHLTGVQRLQTGWQYKILWDSMPLFS